MSSLTNDNSEQIDRKTCRSICDAIGEGLQQNLRPDSSLRDARVARSSA